ncbi:MAG: glycosyltransferase [Polyangiaceae bacterium]|nr:glycosyltransferase [Polyangiaceae bacterium]
MKVLDVTDFYSDRGGGIRSHLDAKGRALARLGIHHVTIAPGARDADEALSVPGAPATARVVRVRGPRQPYDSNYRFLSRTRRAAELVGGERPDVLEINSLYLAALVARRTPTEVAWVRTAFWHSDHIDTHLLPRLARLLGVELAERAVEPAWGAIRSLLGGLDATVVASRSQRDKLERHGVVRVNYVPFGVDRARFGPSARSPEVRVDLLGPGRAAALLCLAAGRLSVEKCWPVVIDAFLALRARRDAVLVVVGDGPERAALGRRAAGHPDVRFHGFEGDRDHFAAMLASADLFIHACPYETFGLGVAEAVACGLPIVVPNAGGASEFVSGPSAVAYAAGDATDCHRAIEGILSLPPLELRAAAHAAAARIGTMDDHFRRVADLYGDLIARSSKVR